MNGIHDLGGMANVGPVRPPDADRAYTLRCELTVHAFSVVLGVWRAWNVDAFRHEIEKLPPARYLTMRYYEKWLHAMIELSVRGGLITRTEADSGRPDRDALTRKPALKSGMVAQVMQPTGSLERPYGGRPAFAVGDAVFARNIHPAGHTRLPRYVRGKHGRVIACHGAHVLPDSNAAGLGEAPQPLYSIAFAARALWGEAANPRDDVVLNLWESYLEPG